MSAYYGRMSGTVPQLTINLLGSFDVRVDNESITRFRADAARALLAYLASTQGIELRREALIGVFAPDNSEEAARGYLRKLLQLLRKAIRDREASPPYLNSNRKTISLSDGAHVQVDVVRFEQLLRAVKQHRHRRLAGCQSCLERLQTAVDLYRGEFLAGYAWDNDVWEAWLRAQRNHFRELAIEALGMLGAWKAGSGAWQDVLALGGRMLRIEVWHEGAHRWVMEAHWRLGDRTAALGQYEKCVAVLWEELGVEPEKETRWLVERIKKQQVTGNGEQVTENEEAHNLPEFRTAFFGRTQPLNTLQEYLTNPQYRLVTLLGEGGVGKSRLSVEAGRQLLPSFGDGVWFVPLVDVEEADGGEAIVTAIAQALDFTFSGTRKPLDQLTSFLREAELLIILDQSEHLLDSAEILLTLLQRTRNLAILATSRQALGFSEEVIVSLTGLDESLDGTADDALQHDPAVQLFAERARRISGLALDNAQARMVAQIIRMVAGNPLAIELAASWTRSLTIAEIVRQITQSADFLATRQRDIPRRHRSMRAVFETSWELLEPHEQTLFAKLSIFRGGFTLGAVRAVAGASLWDLDGLIEKSLLQRRSERYLMHDLLRGFSAEKRPDPDPMPAQHGRYYLQLTADQREMLSGSEPQQAARIIERDEFNIWEAWRWGLSAEINGLMVRCVEVIGRFFQMRGRIDEAVKLSQAALDTIAQQQNMALNCALLTQQIRFLTAQADIVSAEAAVTKALQIAHRLEDNEAIARVLHLQSELHYFQGKYIQACQIASAALEHAEQSHTKAVLLRVLGIATTSGTHDYTLARSYLERALQHCRAIGDKRVEALITHDLANTWFADRQYARARTYYQAALKTLGSFDDVLGLQQARGGLANIATDLNEWSEAIALLEQQLNTATKRGWHRSAPILRYNLGNVYLQLGMYADASHHFSIALEGFRHAQHAQHQRLAYLGLGVAAQFMEKFQDALSWFGEVLNSDDRTVEGYAQHGIGCVYLMQQRWDEAAVTLERALVLRSTGATVVARCETLAAYFRVQVAQQAFDAARQTWLQLVPLLTQEPELSGSDAPLLVYWHCFEGLREMQDKSAETYRQRASSLLVRWAEKIESPEQRNTFLNVPHHRAIQQASTNPD